jgi:hypothetical protein
MSKGCKFTLAKSQIRTDLRRLVDEKVLFMTS